MPATPAPTGRKPVSSILARVWLILPVGALGFLVWINHARLQRIDYVTSLAGGPAPGADAAPGPHPDSAGGPRMLIVPERNENTFEWIAQTEQMWRTGEWRVRHVDYDNAPFGREVNLASPYRWWLGLVSWGEGLISGPPAAPPVERAARRADPLLHALLLIGGTALVAWRFGALAAALFAVGLVTLFPFAANFLPGAPDARALANIGVMGSVLVLLAGLNRMGAASGGPGGRNARRWFALAGVIGGLGAWVSVPTEVPVVAGIFLGAVLAAWVTRPRASDGSQANSLAPPWRTWACSGGATVGLAYLVEYSPAHLGSWHLESVHPLYGLAWIAGGELLGRTVAWIQGDPPAWRPRDLAAVGLAVAGVVALPVAMAQSGSDGFFARDLLWARLTSLPEAAVAVGFRAWLARAGTGPAVLATVAPLLLVGPAVWLLLRRTGQIVARTALAVALGPVLISAAFAWQQPGWWGPLDAALLVLLVAITVPTDAAGARIGRWFCPVLVALSAALGVSQLRPRQPAGPGMTLTTLESQELVERHLAHWLAKRVGEEGVVVYAPPRATTALFFFGRFRGIGTFASENHAGFGAALSIAGAKSMEEVQGLLSARGVRYLIFPSWDPFLEEFARQYLPEKFAGRTGFLTGALRTWNLPPWLRPIPYQLPVGGGFEKQSVRIFEVVDEQSPAVAASRLAEYLVETGELDQAAVIGEALRRYPGDVGALTARAQVQMARRESEGMAQTLDLVRARLTAGADHYLPWDRRVSLAMVLARGGQVELARGQVARCLAEIDEARVRALTTGSLFGLQVLGKAFGVEIADQRLRALALDLLPPDLRERL
jgi:hypothetical protein